MNNIKKIFNYFLITIGVISIILFFGCCILNFIINMDINRFDYNSSKKETLKFLKNNKKELEIIALELRKTKASKNKPYENIRYATYENNLNFSFFKKLEYVKFDIDAFGMLGGQYYGLIYICDNKYINEDLFIYDENKETGNGNNKFIREKIANNWYFYYDDYDGKVNISKIK